MTGIQFGMTVGGDIVPSRCPVTGIQCGMYDRGSRDCSATRESRCPVTVCYDSGGRDCSATGHEAVMVSNDVSGVTLYR